MKCIIIDDELTAITILSQLCTKIPEANIVGEFTSAIDAMKFLNQNEVDLIFLDIHMPGFNGFDFIETIKNPPKIILTTSDPNFAIQAFEYRCVIDYIVKPVVYDRFNKAIKKALSTQFVNDAANSESTNSKSINTNNDLYVNIDRRLIKIDIPSIYLVEAKGDYICLKTETKNYTVHSTLKKIESKLPDALFLKIHRSYIINIKKIIDIEDNSVLIKKDVIPISRANKPELLRRLNLL